MAADFPHFRDGDPVPGPAVLNTVFAELRRLRRATGSGGLVVDAGSDPPLVRSLGPQRMLARLTGAYSGGYPWKEVVFSPGRAVVETGVIGSSTTDPAFERRTGDTTLAAGDTVYAMVRSPASNQWVFPHRPPASSGPTFSCAAGPCSLPATIYATDPVYGFTVALNHTGTPTSGQWTGSATYPSYPGYPGGTGGDCPAGPVIVGYVFSCASGGTLKVQAGQYDPVVQTSFPGAAAAPDFTKTGVFAPMNCAKLSFVCHGTGSFDAVYAGTSAGSVLMSNFFRVDSGTHVFSFALSSVHP